MTADVAAPRPRPRPRRRFRLSLRATLGLVAVVALLCWGYAEWSDPVRRFRREIRDGFGMKRYDAVSRASRGLGDVDRARALVELIDTLDDPDPFVRESAVRHLNLFGADARAAVPALTGLLKDAHPRLRIASATTLSLILEKTGRDDDGSAGVVAALAALLADPAADVRLAAAQSLGRCPKGCLPEPTRRKAVAALARFRDDPKESRRLGAALGLVALDEAEAAMPELIAALRSARGQARSGAIEGIQAAGLPAAEAAVPTLIAIGDDPTFDGVGDYLLKGSRVSAAELLCRLGRIAEGLALLDKALASSDKEVRDDAERTRKRIDAAQGAAAP